MRLPPKVDIAAVRSEAAAQAVSKGQSLGKLVEVLNAAVSREETRAAPNLPAAVKVVAPVVVVLKPGSRSLHGLMPADATERGTLNAFIKDLPVHLAINPREIIGAIRTGLEAEAEAKGMAILDVAIEQPARKPMQIRVQRAHQSTLGAFEPEAKAMVTETIDRIISQIPRPVNLGDTTLSPSDAIALGLLRMVHAHGKPGTKSWRQQVKLSADEVEALIHRRGITPKQPLPEIIADVMRYVLEQPEEGDWARFVPISRNELVDFKDKYVRAQGVATLRELAVERDYDIPRIFQNPLSRVHIDDRSRAMSAIVARVRSNFDHSDEVFQSRIGISRDDAKRMIEGTLEFSPKPIFEVVTKMLSVTDIDDQSNWYLYTSVDKEEAKHYYNQLTRTSTDEPAVGDDTKYTFTANEVLSSVPVEYRPVLAECLSVVPENRLLSDQRAFASVFKVLHKDFVAMLGGATIESPLTPRQLSEAVMSFVCDSDKNYYGALMSFTRDEVRAALSVLRGV